MSGRRTKGGKAKIEMSKPELPAFLQRMREQIVANEDADRIAQSLKKRKERGERAEDAEEGPTIVKLGDDDLTEEEYNRMKLALETQYKLDSELKEQGTGGNEELDVDKLLKSRQAATQAQDNASSTAQAQDKVGTEGGRSTKTRSSKRHKPTPGAAVASKAKKLSYNDDDDDDDSDSSN